MSLGVVPQEMKPKPSQNREKMLQSSPCRAAVDPNSSSITLWSAWSVESRREAPKKLKCLGVFWGAGHVGIPC